MLEDRMAVVLLRDNEPEEDPVTPRMTKEREEEIQKEWGAVKGVKILFAELDALREELANQRLEKEWPAIKERDTLLAKLHSLQVPQAGDEELIEHLAALEHDQWRTWARHLLYHADGEPNISAARKERWEKQINLDYEELDEEWKESDREWARKTLALIQHARAQSDAEMAEYRQKLEFYASRDWRSDGIYPSRSVAVQVLAKFPRSG